jgi:hypothetical protein
MEYLIKLIVRQLADLAEKKAKEGVSFGLGNFDNLYRDFLCELVAKECISFAGKDKEELILNHFGIVNTIE